MKLKFNYLPILALLALFTQTMALSQTDAALLRDLAEENKKSVEALVLYPSETRLAILEATKHPEVLIKMQDMREKTSAAYRTLIEDFPRATQTVFYDLSRYPGLIATLVSQKDDPAALRKTLEVLPEDKRSEGFELLTRQMPTLERINELNETTRLAFGRLINGYPAVAQNAFEHLLDLPEVIDLLNEDLRFTILVGETYRDNPAMIIYKTDSLNLAVARAHAEELEDWRNNLENDPNAKAELEAATKEYASENGYNYEVEDNDDLYYRENVVRVNHYYYPYSYWYGYPWWEPYPRWHPYPWWWDWGCHFHSHSVVIVYLPSYHFMHWYFEHPRHHYHYNHLSAHFVNHYNGHRRSGTTITTGVRDWHERNRTVISDDFLKDRKQLPERLKAFGRFEEGRQNYNARNPEKAVSQEAYLDKNTRKYPELERSRQTAKAEIQREDKVKREQRATWAPSKAPIRPAPAPTPAPKTERPPRVVPKPVKPNNPDTRQPAPRPSPRSQPNEAKDYHRQKWDANKPTQVKPSNRPAAPATKKAPTSKPVSKKRGGQ